MSPIAPLIGQTAPRRAEPIAWRRGAGTVASGEPPCSLSIALQRRLMKAAGINLNSALGREGGRMELSGYGPELEQRHGRAIASPRPCNDGGKNLVESCSTRRSGSLWRPGRCCRLPSEKLGRRAGCLIPRCWISERSHVPSSTILRACQPLGGGPRSDAVAATAVVHLSHQCSPA
jgi:hypothetical protein